LTAVFQNTVASLALSSKYQILKKIKRIFILVREHILRQNRYFWFLLLMLKRLILRHFSIRRECFGKRFYERSSWT